MPQDLEMTLAYSGNSLVLEPAEGYGSEDRLFGGADRLELEPAAKEDVPVVTLAQAEEASKELANRTRPIPPPAPHSSECSRSV